MKTTMKTSTTATYSLSKNQMAFPHEKKQARQAQPTSSPARRKAAAVALGGASLLVISLLVSGHLSLLPALAAFVAIAIAALYYFLVKPVLAIDFDISSSNMELVEIYNDLWD